MKITVLFDNYLARPGLRQGVGFSALVESGDGSLTLFDTGGGGPALFRNMEELGVDPKRIASIVVSHAHVDHAGGLWDMVGVNGTAAVYVPTSLGTRMHRRALIPLAKPAQIAPDIYSTGEMNGIEQSLLLKTEKGIVLLMGCCHPGVGPVLDVASGLGKPFGVVGGLHDFRDFALLEDLSLICAGHCTRHRPEIAALFPKQYRPCGVGLEIRV